MTKVIDAEKVFLTKSGVIHNWALGTSGEDFSVDLESITDKRIVAALHLLRLHLSVGTDICRAIRCAAAELDPPAKAEVLLNPCRKCGVVPMTKPEGHIAHPCIDEVLCVTPAGWNAANPVQPVAEEKRYRPGQKFLHLGQHDYSTFTRQDGTVGVISSEHAEQDGYSCRIVDGGFTMKDLFGSWAKNWQPID